MQHSTLQASCPCCGHSSFMQLLAFPLVPVSGIYRDTTDAAQLLADLAWEVCVHCGLLRNCNFLSPPDYVAKPRPTERQLPSYLQELLGLMAASTDMGDVVIEIGANDGSFLDLLRKAGYSNLHGVEPSEELARIARSKGHHIVEDYFTEAGVAGLLQACGAPKFVICRHTLEHVPDPASFTAGIRALLAPAAGSALLEVPDSTAMWEGINFVELWDEHLFYFTPQSLRRLVRRCGLTVLAGQEFPHLETRNLMLHIGVPPTGGTALAETQLSEVPQWIAFAENFRRRAEQLRQAVLTAPKPLYLMGASHPQTNLVNFVGWGDQVDFMVDDDPEKRGKLPPIQSARVQVVSSVEFAAHPPGGTLVLSGLGYAKWADWLSATAMARAMDLIDPRHYSASE